MSESSSKSTSFRLPCTPRASLLIKPVVSGNIYLSSYHKTLLQWYRSGQDTERRLPVLSTFLGHVNISDTYWYLSAWPELMNEAMKRLEQRWGSPS